GAESRGRLLGATRRRTAPACRPCVCAGHVGAGLRRDAHDAAPAVEPEPLLTRSLRTWDERKTKTRRGLIGTSSPVLGLRPTRSPFMRTRKLPKDEILTLSPRASASEISLRTLS